MGSGTPFIADVQSRDGVAKITLSGELDMATAPKLGEQLKRSEADGVTAIILDLRDVTFMDSTGLVACLEARDRATANGHRFMVIEAGPAPKRVFEITGTGYLLEDVPVDGRSGDGVAAGDSVAAI